MKKRTEAAEMWFLRRMLRTSWIDKVNNEEVLRKTGVKRKSHEGHKEKADAVSGACNEIRKNGESDANRED